MPRTVEIPGFGITLENVPDDMTDQEAAKAAMQEAIPALRPTGPRREALGAQIPGGGEVEPGEVFEGAGGLGSRFQASTANLITEKSNVISKRLPGSQIEIVTDPDTLQPTILVRFPGQEKFVEFDSPDFLTMGDAVDALGPLTSMQTLGMIAAGMATRGTTGLMGAMARPLMQGIGAGLGSLAQSGLQWLGGGELESPETVAGQAQMEALSGAGMSAILEPVGLATRGATRLARAGEEITEVSEAARALGMEGLTLAESHPLFKNMMSQATRTSAYARNWNLDRLHNDAAQIERFANELMPQGVEGATIGQLIHVTNQWEKQLKDAIASPVRMDTITAGRHAAMGIHRFVGAREELARRFEDQARRASMAPGLAKDIVKFDLTDVQRVGTELKHGVRGRLLHGTERAIAELPERPAQSTQVLNIMPEPARRLIDDINRLNPSVELFYTRGGGPGRPQDPYSQMVELRNRAFALASDPRTERYGKPIYDSLVRTMNNPAGGNAEFRVAHRRAVKTRTSTETLLNDALGRELLRQVERPQQFGRELIGPERGDIMRRAKALIVSGGGRDKWDLARGGYFNKLMHNPSTIVSELDRWEPRDLRQVMSRQEEAAFRQYGSAWQHSNLAHVQRLISEEGTLGRDALNTILKGTPAQLQSLVTEMGGKDTPLGRAMRAGLWRQLFDATIQMKQGRLVHNPGAVSNIVQELKASGRLEAIMTPGEIRAMEDIERYLSYMPSEAGMAEAAGMQAQSVTSGVFSAPFTNRSIRSMLTAGRNSFMARMMIHPKTRSILIGKAGQGIRKNLNRGNELYKALQVIGPAMWIAAQDMDKDALTLFGPHPEGQSVDPAIELENQRMMEMIWGPEPPQQ